MGNDSNVWVGGMSEQVLVKDWGIKVFDLGSNSRVLPLKCR